MEIDKLIKNRVEELYLLRVENFEEMLRKNIRSVLKEEYENYSLKISGLNQRFNALERDIKESRTCLEEAKKLRTQLLMDVHDLTK